MPLSRIYFFIVIYFLILYSEKLQHHDVICDVFQNVTLGAIVDYVEFFLVLENVYLIHYNDK